MLSRYAAVSRCRQGSINRSKIQQQSGDVCVCVCVGWSLCRRVETPILPQHKSRASSMAGPGKVKRMVVH